MRLITSRDGVLPAQNRYSRQVGNDKFNFMRTSYAGGSHFARRDGSILSPSNGTSNPIDGSLIIESLGDAGRLATESSVRHSLPVSPAGFMSPSPKKPFSPPVLDYDALKDRKSVRMKLPGIMSPVERGRKKPLSNAGQLKMPDDMFFSSMNEDTNMELIRDKIRM